MPSRYLLAPLAGYTNLSFRLAVRGLGGLGLATTDLVNARALLRRSVKTMDLLQTCPEDRPVAEALRLPTRLVDLHPITRADAAREFGDASRVIPHAVTLGIAPILAARSILILATGAHKAEAVVAALTGPMTAALPASLLQAVAPKVTWILDEAAARGLPRQRSDRRWTAEG